MREFLEDLRNHWDDSYWWADHQLLMACLVGLVSLSFALVEAWCKRQILGGADA